MVKSSKSQYKLPIPHDSVFRTSMSNPEIAIPFCQTYVMETLSNKIDYSTMHIIDRSFVDEQLRNYASDVILEFDLLEAKENQAKTKDSPPNKVQIAIIIEHQSTPDKFMAFRMVHYMFGYLYEQLKGNKSDTQLLTPVYPLLFYNGIESPYPYSLDLYEVFADPYGIMKYVLNNDIKLIDVSLLEESELKNQKLLGLMTRAMKFRTITQETVDYLNDFFIDLHLELVTSKGIGLNRKKEYFETLITYLASISEATEFRQALEQNDKIPEATKGEFMTAAEYYIQQGETRGESRGEKRGEKRGKIEVATNALKKGFDVEMVVDLTGLDIKVVEQLQQDLDKP